MLFIISICSFVLMALLYILFATPIYEASTSVLIDSSGRNRVLGESEYVEGGVSLIEIEKNLFNEVGIIKSFSLIEQTVKDLNLNVSYYTNGIFSEKEHYGYFPFEVMLTRDKAQLYDMPFEIQLMAGNRYKLSIEGKDFMVSNPKNGTMREMTSDFNFSKIYKYGELVKHDFFSFTLKKPNYPVAPTEFEDKKLTFVIHETTGITKAYADKLDVNNIDIQASILKINSTGALIDKEVAFLKKLTENYMGNKLKTRNKIASDKEEFIQKQLKVISDSLMKMEADLEFFKRDENAVNLNSTASNAMSQSQYLQSDAAKLKLDIQQYNSILRSVNANKNSDEFVMPSAIGINNPLLNDNILELKRLYTERSKKKFFVTSNNEEMSILNGQIKEATALLVNNLESAIKSSQIALSGAQSQLAGFDEELNSLPMRENQLLTIQRQSTLYENMFNYMNEELAKTGIARAESTSDTQILDEARMVGNGPIAPQKSLLLVLALALGTLLPMTWVVFSPNDLIENIDQIFANTEMPVIASIIYHDSNTKKRRRVSRHTKSVPFSFFWQAKENLRGRHYSAAC